MTQMLVHQHGLAPSDIGVKACDPSTGVLNRFFFEGASVKGFVPAGRGTPITSFLNGPCVLVKFTEK